MAKMIELFVVMTVFLSAASNVQKSYARTYNVGDNSGWSTPSGGASTYTAWANQYRFVVGDILVFNFNTGLHTVARVNNKNDYDSCTTGNGNVQSNGPANVTLNSTGDYYFFCTVHCSQGQKLTVNVGSGNNNGSPPSPSPPGTNPSPGFGSSPPPPPPPPPSAATTSATLLSGLIILPILLVML